MNKTQFLKYSGDLSSRDDKRFWLGQTSEIWNADGTSVQQALAPIQAVKDQTGKWPALWGMICDQATRAFAYDRVKVAIPLSKQAWSVGAIPQVSWYSDNPFTGKPGSAMSKDQYQTWGNPNSAQYKNTVAQMQGLINWLLMFMTPAQVLLLRIFIEPNGGWNYYGYSDSVTGAICAAWYKKFKTMLDAAGLSGVVLVYNSNQDLGNYLAAWPGKDVCEMAGIDVYAAGQAFIDKSLGGNLYQSFTGLGVPIYLPEYGVGSGNPGKMTLNNMDVINAVHSKLPKLIGGCCWSQSMSLGIQKNLAGLVGDPWVIDASEVPATYGDAPPVVTPPVVSPPPVSMTVALSQAQADSLAKGNALTLKIQ